MLRRLNKLIKGGKRVKLVGGPGNGITFVMDGKAQALEYEVQNKKYYYKWEGLTDGIHDLYSFLGCQNQDKPLPNIQSNILLPNIQNNIITPNMFSGNFDPDATKLKYKMNIK